MNTKAFDNIISGVLFLFGMSVLVSMAGLEIFGSCLMLGAFVLYLTQKKSLRFLKPLSYAFIPLFLVVIFSLIVNELWEPLAFTIGWHRWFIFLSALTYLLRYVKSGQTWLIRGLYTGLVVSCINGILQFITKYDFIRHKDIIYFADLDKQIVRVTSFFNMPTTYGYILSFFIFIPIALLVSKEHKKYRGLHLSVLLLTLLSLSLTFTRGAWISFVVGLSLFIFLGYRKFVLPLLITGGTVALTLFLTHEGFNERISSLIDPTYYSNSQRIELWSANIEMFFDHPILGVGYNHNDKIVSNYHLRLDHNESFDSHAHNNYLQFLAGTGLLGLIAFLYFLRYFNREITRQIREASSENKTFLFALSSILVTFLISMVFDVNFGDAEVRYSFLTYMALVVKSSKS